MGFAFSSLFIQNQFGVGAVLAVGGHEEKIRSGEHAEAAGFVGIARELIAEVGLIIVQKGGSPAARERIGEVDIPTSAFRCLSGGIPSM